MKFIISLLFVLFLTGCAAQVKPIPPVSSTVTKTVYVIAMPPAADLTLPAYPPTINTNNMQQSDVASWIATREEMIQQLREQIINIGQFLKSQQQKLNSTK